MWSGLGLRGLGSRGLGFRGLGFRGLGFRGLGFRESFRVLSLGCWGLRIGREALTHFKNKPLRSIG